MKTNNYWPEVVDTQQFGGLFRGFTPRTARHVCWISFLLFTALVFGINFNSNAQPTRNFRPGTNTLCALLQNPGITNIPGAVEVISQVLATPAAPKSVPVISTSRPVSGGTFWTMQWPVVPLPEDFYPDLPVYELDATNRIFVIDDRSVDYPALQAQQTAEDATNGTVPFGLRANDLIIDTNRLWLSVATNALPGSNQFNVVIHETVTGTYYDVLTKSDLLDPTWAVESTAVGAVGNETPVTLAQNDRTNLFVWARESIIPIYTQPITQEVAAGDSVTFSVVAGGSGLFYQWTLNGTNIFGATGSSYTIDNVNANNAGDYACIVSNANGTVLTQSATLMVDQGSGWPYDMTTIGQRQDYTFRSGVTYNITQPIQLYGKTTIEGGAIIKFDYNYLYPCLIVMGTLQCDGTAYNPAVLTSIDDDTFGTTEQDSTGSPQPVFTGVPFLDLTYAGNVSLSNLRLRYADMAVGAPYYARVDVWDSQFVQCYAGVVNDFGGTDGFHNVLFAGCFDAVGASTNGYAIEMEQVTADVSNIWDSAFEPSSMALTNSIVFGSIGSVDVYSAQNVTVGPNPTDFQINGTGNYYLAAASSLRQSGTTNISARLLTDFSQKTTTQPLALPQLLNLSGNLTLSQQAARYLAGAPDRGYYYDALDYTVAYLTVSGNLTVEPGTAVGIRNEPTVGGYYYTWWGLDLRENSSVVSHGMPNHPNIFADTQLVQEQDEYASSSLIVPDFQGMPSDNAPVMDFRFSKLYAPAGGFQVWGGDWELVDYGDNLASYDSLVNWTMRDCELHGGRISLGLPNIQMDLTQYYGAGGVDWENNLFESVNINLNPATWWWNGVVNFDESLTARNNLFKGANWMAIEPVPASAGNWTFTDNLFDGIDFQVDANAPLDFDFNGYYPLPASQTLYNTLGYVLSLTAGDSTKLVSATNDLGALHEIILNSAPPYASGAFGNYYLTSLTPLWQAGSRTAADAGLTQYTTFTNQAKDSASQPVNVGLHYVAASTNNLPLDSDGDGVPDYVEVEYGTDPNNPMTDGVTPDVYNAAYDFVDLDGDGLTGYAEKLFGTNPLVPDNPLVLNFADGATISGEMKIPLNLNTNLDSTTNSFELLVNGSLAEHGEIEQTSDGSWSCVFDTTTMSNGIYFVQLRYTYPGRIATALYPNSPNISGPMVVVNVNNLLTFDVLSSDFASTLYVKATVNSPADFYTVNIYNLSDTNTVIQTITGAINNGVIDTNWDLTDGNNNVLANGDLLAVFTLTSAQSFNSNGQLSPMPADASASTIQRIYRQEPSDLSDNNFVVSYGIGSPDPSSGDYYYSGADYAKIEQAMIAEVVDSLCNPGLDHEYWLLPPGNAWDCCVFHLANAVNASVLLSSISSGNNFMFFGEAGDTSVGWAPGFLKASDVANTLGYGTNSVQRHPYRLVFLDGCNTYSKKWANAFGVPFSANGSPWTSADFQAVGRAPRAFVGMTQSVMAPTQGWVEWQWDIFFQAHAALIDSWMGGETIQQSMLEYRYTMIFYNVFGFTGARQYADRGYSWQISGCPDLTKRDPDYGF